MPPWLAWLCVGSAVVYLAAWIWSGRNFTAICECGHDAASHASLELYSCPACQAEGRECPGLEIMCYEERKP
jgi:hypothetical protein